jgi:hypothetical protein
MSRNMIEEPADKPAAPADNAAPSPDRETLQALQAALARETHDIHARFHHGASHAGVDKRHTESQ